MPTDLATVFNLALSSCGSAALVSDPDEHSREAALCRLWLPHVLGAVLISAPWSSALKNYRLARTAVRTDTVWSSTDPAPSYLYSYSLPSDLILPYHLHSFSPFVLRGDSLSTADNDPILVGISRLEDASKWDELLKQCVVHYLAAHIARPLTGASDVVSQQYQLAVIISDQMRAAAAEMLQQPMSEVLPDWIAARGYGSYTTPRFFHAFSHLSPIAA